MLSAILILTVGFCLFHSDSVFVRLLRKYAEHYRSLRNWFVGQLKHMHIEICCARNPLVGLHVCKLASVRFSRIVFSDILKRLDAMLNAGGGFIDLAKLRPGAAG